MWSIADIADILMSGLRGEAERLDLEQAVSGLDAREEVELHSSLEAALRRGGYGVFREQRYPADRRKRRESEGERCDLVLTMDGRPLAVPEAEPGLFADPDAVELESAFWLEVKLVQQFRIDGPNQSYASQLLSAVREDVTKLSKDRDILHAGLLIVLFVAEPAVAEHDLGVWQDRCLDRALPISAPSIRHFSITDRIGNASCTLALYRVAHL